VGSPCLPKTAPKIFPSFFIMSNIVSGVLCCIYLILAALFVLFACCAGAGLSLRFFLPKEFSLLNKVFFSLTGGLFLVVLLSQNLVYLGVPIRISAWLLLAGALVQVWWCRHRFTAWRRAFYLNAEIRTLAVVVLLTITFHGRALSGTTEKAISIKSITFSSPSS
jgi:hypothetical protein